MKKMKKFRVMVGTAAMATLLIVPTVLTSCWNGSNIVTNTPNYPTVVPPSNDSGSIPGDGSTSNPGNPVVPPVDDSTNEPTTPPVSPPETSPENPSDETPVIPPVEPDKEGYIKGVDYFLASNTPSGQEDNKEYWITNPNTQNDYILQEWGNVPLPMKNDVSKDDAYNYFTYVAVNNQIGRPYTFGKRKIETDWIINVFIEWLIKNWTLYPWMSFENHPAYFETNKLDPTQDFDYDDLVTWRGKYPEYFEKNKFYMNRNKFSNSADFITIQSQQRDAYFEMIRLFLTNYYRPGMSDLDKALTVFNFVMSYIAYGDSNNDPYGAYMKHMGVCVHYAFTAAFLLNLIGVPSFMNTAHNLYSHPNVSRPGHAVNWVWIDADNSGEKKWYIMDATFSDYEGETTWPSAYVSTTGSNWSFFLDPVSDIEGGNIDYNLSQNSFFQFLNGPWYSPFKNKNVKVSPDYSYLDNKGTYQNIRSSFGNNKNSQSRPIWYNNNWYSLIIENDREVKIYKTSMNDAGKEEIKIPDNIIKDIKTNNTVKYSKPFAGTYNDWMAFSVFETPDYTMGTPFKKARKIYFHNFKDSKWKNTETMEIKNEVLYTDENGKEYKTENATFQTFFFDNDQLCIEYSFKNNGGKTFASVIKRYDLPEKVQIKNDTYLDSKVVENAKIYYKLVGNTHKIGVENQQITLEMKENYNKYYNDFKSTNKPYEDVIKLKEYSDNFEKSLLTAKENVASGISSDIYLSEQDTFDQYGYYFDDINPGFDSFYNLSNNQYNTTLKYDIYFAPESSNEYKLLQKDLYKPIIKKSYFKEYNNNPNGKYYIKMHNQDNSLLYETEPFYFAISDSKNVAYIPEQPRIDYTEVLTPYTPQGQTNYYDRFIYDWYDKEYQLLFNYQWSRINTNYDITVNLKSFEFKTKKIKTLKTWNDPLKKEKYVIGKINENNKGIYYLDIELKYKNNQKKFHLYSSFMYMITKNDVDSKNFSEWVNLSKQLKEEILKENPKPQK
ncbi:transglutaminase domain-containing protein [Malacoplasma iowae]|uniref:transglutaminase domain-containing protein n=1 Tax=Malacoplasma iowae TaxID=2116 RepID=UPI002A1875F6|nr:transglutaminase domain-containing protein [Malacoplasma iowae]WPL37794.1 transglutaminase domain-containing protein [Malacoplasma iowae]